MLKYRLRKIGRKKIIFWSATLLIFVISMSSIIRFYAAYSGAISSHEGNSGTIIDNRLLVVNDMDSDWNYYQSLNYTEITSTTALPTKANRYSESNLAKVEVVYDGIDVNDSSVYGKIDNTDNLQGFVYYKYYPIEGNKIKIELIDNPYEIRPNGKAFNGWVCNADKSTSGVCDTSVLSYDDEYYVRYITVSASSSPITVYLNASWTGATESNNVNDFSDKTMKTVSFSAGDDSIPLKGLTITTSKEQNNNSGKYLADDYYYYSGTVSKGSTISAGSYYYRTRTVNMGWLSYTIYTYAYVDSATKCPDGRANNNYSSCYVYKKASKDTLYDSSKTYYTCQTATSTEQSQNYNNPCSIANPVSRYDITTTYNENEQIGSVNESSIENLNMVSYYYKYSGDYSGNSAYYDAYGLNCDDRLANCSSTVYKLIQNSDTTIANYSADASTARTVTYSDLKNYYSSAGVKYAIETTTNLLYATDDAGNTIDVNGNKSYLVATYNGTDYRLASDLYTNIYFVSVAADGTITPLTDSDGNIVYLKVVDIDANYKYLVTRDTNIYTGTSLSNTPNVPLNIEGSTVNVGYFNSDIRISNGATITTNFSANANNVKVCRTVNANGITLYGANANGGENSRFIVEGGIFNEIIGQNGGGTSLERQMILGSDYDKAKSNNSQLTVTKRVAGTTNATTNSYSNTSTTPTMDITVKSGSYGMGVSFGTPSNATATYGDDDANSKLEIKTNDYTTYTHSTSQIDFYTYGIVVGKQDYNASTTNLLNTALWNLKVEGGNIFNIVGGFGTKSSGRNAISIYMTGGYASNVIGGSQFGEAYGNRIVAISGGKVGNAVAGGGNGFGYGDTKLDDETLVYVGGSAEIGYKLDGYDYLNRSLYGIEYRGLDTTIAKEGNVYGGSLGDGNSKDDSRKNKEGNYDVYASHVIINGGTINGSVYGGGNFGRIRKDNASTSTTVEIYAGDIKYDVYGASNFNGFGCATCNGTSAKTNQTKYKDTVSSLTTTIYGGTIHGNVYGGNNGWGHGKSTWFDVMANVVVNINGGTIKGNVYTGGSGSHTYVFGNTTLNINGGTIEKNAYGGGAMGDVNCASGGLVKDASGRTVTGGDSNSISGACKNAVLVNNTSNPQYYSDNEALLGAGDTMLMTKVTVDGGTVNGAVFGAGRGKSGYTDDDTTSKETYFSDSRGIIEVIVKSGNVGAVYGGNDDRGDLGAVHDEGDQKYDYTSHIRDVNLSSTTMHVAVLIEGGTIGEVYGAGKGEYTSARYTYVKVTGGTINSVYGGSNEGIASDTLVEIEGGKVENVFGGSNQSALIDLSKTGQNNYLDTDTMTTITNGVNSIYTNATSGNSKVIIDGKTVEVSNAYGGGLSGKVPTTNITINSGKATNLFGGGKAAAVDTTNVLLKGGTVDTAFGGSDQSGAVGITYVALDGATVNNIYGGNNVSGSVDEAYVSLLSGKVTDSAYGGGYQAYVKKRTDIDLNGATITNNAYGGGNNAGVENETYGTRLRIISGSVTDAYGGSNNDGFVANTNMDVGEVEDVVRLSSDSTTDITRGKITVDSNGTPNTGTLTVNDIYGGNNAGGYVKNASVVTTGGTGRNVYGGGNNAKVTEATSLLILGGTFDNVFGGGNHSFVGNAESKADGSYSTGVSEGTTQLLLVKGTIKNNVYGSSNSSYVYGTTNVYIGGEPWRTYKKYAVSEGFDVPEPDLTIGGDIFGGSETNSKESDSWDYTYQGVVGNTYVYIDGSDFDEGKLNIDGALYGKGNNSNVSETSNIYVSNFGTSSNVKKLASIQRATNVYLTDSVIELIGEHDRTYKTKYYFGLIRIDHLYLLGSSGKNDKGTTLYMNSGAEFLEEYNSGTMGTTSTASYNAENFKKQQTAIDETTKVVTNTNSNNKLFVHTNVIFAVANDQSPSYIKGNNVAKPIVGMTYYGMYTNEDGKYETGIYDSSLTNGTNVTDTRKSISETAYSFVYGLHNTDETYDYTKMNNGFYSHFENGTDTDGDGSDDSYTLSVDYVGMTPKDDTYYKWVLGDEPIQIDVSLEATKSSIKSAQLASITLEQLKEEVSGEMKNWRDATMTIKSINTERFKVNTLDIADGDSWDLELVDKSNIPTVNTKTITTTGGKSVSAANGTFALSMGTVSSGWLDNYRTNLYDAGVSLSGSDTNFCTGENGNGQCTGSDVYTYDSTDTSRALAFWLYYSKNLDFDLSAYPDDDVISIDLGTILVNTEFYNPNGDVTDASNVVSVTIAINVSMTNNKADKYGVAITSGKQYEAFENSPDSNITTNGSVSIYQMLSINLHTDEEVAKNSKLYSANKLYSKEATEAGTTYTAAYRYLKSQYVFPVGTKITMLDLVNNEQYYYEVTSDNYSTTLAEYNERKNLGDAYAMYKLRDFIKMGNTKNVTANHFDDDMNGEKSTKYLVKNGDSELAVEEFIFTVDFANAETPTSGLKYLYMEIGRDSTESGTTTTSTIMLPDGEPDTDIRYNIIDNVDTTITTNGGFVDDEGNISNSTSIYNTDIATLKLNTSLVSKQGTVDVNSSADTTYNDYKLGAKITIMQPKKDPDTGEIVKQDGEIVYEPVTNNLFGAIATINGTAYYPQTDGSIRLTLAGRMTDVISNIKLDFSNASLVFGDYKLVVETFASYDGLYYGDFDPTVNEYYFTLLNNEYGIDVSLPSVEVTRDSNTGKDKNGNLLLTYSLKTKNGLANPSVKVHLERRTYNTADDLTYENVALTNFASSLKVGTDGANVLTADSCYEKVKLADGSCYVYNLTDLNNDLAEQDLTVYMKMNEGPTAADIANPVNAGWKSGTYRLVFDMYDGDTLIGTVYEYLIIRSLDVDESIEGS